MVWIGRVSEGTARRGRSGVDRLAVVTRGAFGYGMVGEDWRGLVWHGPVGPGMAGLVRRGAASPGVVRRGQVRPDEDRIGMARVAR